MFVDYYSVLCLQPSCSAKEVREAFKRLALLYHPDRLDEGDAKVFRGVLEAYDVLSDPARRYLYDLDYAEARQRRVEGGAATATASRGLSGASREAVRAVTRQGSALPVIRGLRAAVAEQQQQQNQQEQQQQRYGDVCARVKKATVPNGCQIADDFPTVDMKQPSVAASKSSQISGEGAVGLSRGEQRKTTRKQQRQRQQNQEQPQANTPQQVCFGMRHHPCSPTTAKAIVPQWDKAKSFFGRVRHSPETDMYCRSIIKTWRAFFHMPEVFQDEK